MRLLVSVAFVAHLAVSYAFQSGCLPLRSSQVHGSNSRVKSCDVKMAAMVNVKVNEKTGVKSFTCEKLVPKTIYLIITTSDFWSNFEQGRSFENGYACKRCRTVLHDERWRREFTHCITRFMRCRWSPCRILYLEYKNTYNVLASDHTGKLWNCNGYGQCGTCKVELLSGPTTPRTDAENKLLAKDPASFRLACQTCVLGQVTVRNKPDA